MPIHRMPIRRMLIMAAASQTPRRKNPYLVRPRDQARWGIERVLKKQSRVRLDAENSHGRIQKAQGPVDLQNDAGDTTGRGRT
jgi:hypothetical protein